ncbi:hypothetical protein [Novilysobacter arseniciresistens]|uniref:hypothetical protein n=1 Tax=Novilysobacter arseniciresistens TaxID=1385522 RepID=UPI00126997C2|nr:hypothetical protein [Lysobacter arseniciresistens]
MRDLLLLFPNADRTAGTTANKPADFAEMRPAHQPAVMGTQESKLTPFVELFIFVSFAVTWREVSAHEEDQDG